MKFLDKDNTGSWLLICTFLAAVAGCAMHSAGLVP
jgi:hypothetical protein